MKTFPALGRNIIFQKYHYINFQYIIILASRLQLTYKISKSKNNLVLKDVEKNNVD